MVTSVSFPFLHDWTISLLKFSGWLSVKIWNPFMHAQHFHFLLHLLLTPTLKSHEAQHWWRNNGANSNCFQVRMVFLLLQWAKNRRFLCACISPFQNFTNIQPKNLSRKVVYHGINFANVLKSQIKFLICLESKAETPLCLQTSKTKPR